MKTTKWVLDPTHSELGFKVRHLMISNVSGAFTNFNVEAETFEEDFSSAEIIVTADMASVSTHNEQRDAHLRRSDFFDVESHPELNFKSTQIEKGNDDSLILYGDLTLKGVTKPVQLNVEFNGIVKDPWGGERAGFLLSGKINRKDWGINFDVVTETGGLMLGEEIKINGEIQLLKQAASLAA